MPTFIQCPTASAIFEYLSPSLQGFGENLPPMGRYVPYRLEYNIPLYNLTQPDPYFKGETLHIPLRQGLSEIDALGEAMRYCYVNFNISLKALLLPSGNVSLFKLNSPWDIAFE